MDFSIPEGTFADIDDATLTLSAAQADGAALPAWLSFAGGRFAGTPPAGGSTLTLRVTASDGRASVSDDFVLTVSASNRPPVVARVLADRSSPEDAAVDFALPADSFTDPDGDALTLGARRADGTPLPAWMSFANGRFTGTPPAHFTGAIDVEVTATDGKLTAADVFRLTVQPVNDAPTLAAALLDQRARVGTAFNWTVPTGAFADVDGDALTLTAALPNGAALPAWLSFSAGRFTGTPPQGAANVTVRVTASDGRASVSDDVLIAVLAGNRAPTAANDGVYVVKGGDPLTILGSSLLANDADLDGDALTVVAVTGASKGAVRLEGGNVVYTPTVGYQGRDRVTYTVSDGKGGTAEAFADIAVTDPYVGWVQASAGADLLFGNMTRANSLAGNDGNDLLTGGALADRLSGGAGNDLLVGLDGDDQLWGLGGDDVLVGGGGRDTAYYSGLRSTYALRTGAGNLYLTVSDGSAADGLEGRDTLIGVETLSFRNGETVSIASPIALDLDGDGVELLSAAESTVRFDMDGDGVADDTSWVGGDDGFLFIDRDRDGTVSGAAELSFVGDVADARSDLEGLAAFDSDGNGRIAQGDARFADFRVWRDADGDGRVDAGEVRTLADHGIASVSLKGVAVAGGASIGGAAVLNTGSFAKLGGGAGGFADVALSFFSGGSAIATELAFGAERLAEKRSKYRIDYADGTMAVVRKGRDAATELDGATTMRFKDMAMGMLSAVVLDLDGDGVTLRSLGKTKARFDMDGNGAAEKTGWVKGGDGFLVVDRNRDGRITDAAELSLLAEAPGARTNVEALAAFDMNGDGVLDAKDARFAELSVWRDADGDGVTDAGELVTLESLGITAIGLGAKANSGRASIGDNIWLAQGGFRRADDSVGAYADAALAFAPAAAPTGGASGSAAAAQAAARGTAMDDRLAQMRRALAADHPFLDLEEIAPVTMPEEAGVPNAGADMVTQDLPVRVPAEPEAGAQGVSAAVPPAERGVTRTWLEERLARLGHLFGADRMLPGLERAAAGAAEMRTQDLPTRLAKEPEAAQEEAPYAALIDRHDTLRMTHDMGSFVGHRAALFERHAPGDGGVI